MQLIVGLGNPGGKYKNNRHNVGHLFVDYLKRHPRPDRGSADSRFRENDLKLIKTDVFMNLSGSFVKKLIKNFKLKIKNLIIVHDDLDIPLGKFKIQKGQGPKLHNGIASIEKALKTKDFWRIRIGVDSRTNETWTDGESYVLSDFEPGEKEVIEKTFVAIYRRLVNII